MALSIPKSGRLWKKTEKKFINFEKSLKKTHVKLKKRKNVWPDKLLIIVLNRRLCHHDGLTCLF